jgi:hypothetical protein
MQGSGWGVLSYEPTSDRLSALTGILLDDLTDQYGRPRADLLVTTHWARKNAEAAEQPAMAAARRVTTTQVDAASGQSTRSSAAPTIEVVSKPW